MNWNCICVVLLLTLTSQGFAKKHSRHHRHGNIIRGMSRTEISSKKSGDFQEVPGLMDSGPNLGGGPGGMNSMGGMGDLSMGFGAGATSIGEGGGATMEGMPSMMGGAMQMPGGMAGAAGMQMQGGMEGGPMAMPLGGGAGGAQEGALMSKQFIEGPGGMGGGMHGMPNIAGMTGMGGIPQMGGMQQVAGMGGMGGMGGLAGVGGGITGMNMEGGMPNMGGIENAGGAGAMFAGAQEIGGQMGGAMGGPMSSALQNAIGGSIPGMAQKRTKMGKVHKALSKLLKKKNVKKHHKN